MDIQIDRSGRIEYMRFPEQLHVAIFQQNTYWRGYAHLRKLSDYYKTNHQFHGAEVEQMVSEFRCVMPYLNEVDQVRLDVLLREFEKDGVSRVRFVGD